MILPDTSVWIDHLSKPNPDLAQILEAGEVLLHPFVAGEIALGNLRHRQRVMWFLSKVDVARQASAEDVLDFIEGKGLGGSGIGYVDAHLLASCLLTKDCKLWTSDRRLGAVAQKLELHYSPG